jgi:hypothetical protein
LTNTESIARLRLKTEQRIKSIMDQARKREATHLERAKTSRNRKSHYERLAADEIRLAQELCGELVKRLKSVQDMKNERKVQKLPGGDGTSTDPAN